jgi:hypothetical protein
VAGGLERGRKGLREGSQKKNGAELPRVPATRGLEGSEGFRGLEGCRPAAAHGRGSTATAPVIEGPATANELVSAPHDFTHVRDCGHPTVCRRGGRIRMRRPRRQTASAIRAGLLRQGAATPPPRRHSSAAPAWLPPAMSPPAAAPSRRRQLPPALQRQLSLLPRRRRGHECHRHECRRRQRRHGRCRRQAGERGAPYECVCLEAVWRFRFSGETPGISTKRASCLP